MPKPSQSSLFHDEIYLLQLCLHPDPLVTDFVFPRDAHHSSLVNCVVRLLASSFVQPLEATILYRITLWTSLMTHAISL